MEYYPLAQYFCYTDNSLGVEIECIPVLKRPTLHKWWNKLALFSSEMPLTGKCLYIDLDMDIKNDPRPFLHWDGLTVTDAYWKKDMYMAKHAFDVTINSSVITWIAGDQQHIWKHFITNKDYFMRKYEGIDRFLIHEGFDINTFKHGLVSSKSYPTQGAIDMYNGIDYVL